MGDWKRSEIPNRHALRKNWQFASHLSTIEIPDSNTVETRFIVPYGLQPNARFSTNTTAFYSLENTSRIEIQNNQKN
jgi:hypothetical protein